MSPLHTSELVPAQEAHPSHAPRQRSPAVAGSFPTTLLVAVLIVAVLYIGREILMPIALAVLMSFVLAPLVRLLRLIYLPRLIAVALVVLIAFTAVFALAGIMVSQVNQLATDLPRYQINLRDKIQALRGAAASTSTLERASEVLQNLGKELERPREETRTPAAAGEKPIPVEVRQPDPGALQTLAALIAPLVHPLATTGIVVIFVIFILMQQQDLRNRLVRLAGSGDLQRTTAAMNEAGERLSRLFVTQLLLNAAFGIVIGAGLWMIGVPSAPLWGMLAMILRFVPYIGALISAVFPLVLAIAVGSGWSMALYTALLFLVVEPLTGHVIEPLVYGHSSGLSPVAVVGAAAFWTWLWGPVGLVLATPLTICLVVLGRHVERLKFLEVLLGDRPALKPPELVYQRMLADDPVEATEQAWRFLKERPLIAYYDDVLMGGLRLAQADDDRGALDEASKEHIRDSVAELVDDLESYKDGDDAESEAVSKEAEKTPLARITKVERGTTDTSADAVPAQWRTGRAVLCVPGTGMLDEAVAIVLTELLQRGGIAAKASEAGSLSLAKFFALDLTGVRLLCLCYLKGVRPAQIGYAVRRIRRKAPEVRILIALFGDSNADEDAGEATRDIAGIEIVKGSLAETVEHVMEIATRDRDSATRADETPRLRATP